MSLPLPSELSQLISLQIAAQTVLHQHRDLQSQLSTVAHQRASGNNRMDLMVELVNGTGFWSEGKIEDTEKVYVSLGKEDLFLEMKVEQALSFVEKRCDQLERRIRAQEEEIDRRKKDHDLVTETLKKAMGLDDAEESKV